MPPKLQAIDWFQITGLITGGLLISVAATLVWIDSGVFGRTGIDDVEGKITFALGGVAVLLGALRIAVPTSSIKVIATALGSWLSTVVIMLAIAVFWEIKASENLLAFLRSEPASGLYLTVIGGAIAGVGSLLGLVPSQPVRLGQRHREGGQAETPRTS